MMDDYPEALVDLLVDKAKDVVASRNGRTEYNLAGRIDEMYSVLHLMGVYE